MGTEEKEKPITLILKITMPTKETIASAIQKLFPFSNLYDIKVSVEEEKKPPQPGPTSAPIDVKSLEPEEASPVKPED